MLSEKLKILFSQEDHSDRDGNGNNQVLTDQPLEEHLEEMVDCDDSGTVDEDYPLYHATKPYTTIPEAVLILVRN